MLGSLFGCYFLHCHPTLGGPCLCVADDDDVVEAPTRADQEAARQAVSMFRLSLARKLLSSPQVQYLTQRVFSAACYMPHQPL